MLGSLADAIADIINRATGNMFAQLGRTHEDDARRDGINHCHTAIIAVYGVPKARTVLQMSLKTDGV